METEEDHISFATRTLLNYNILLVTKLQLTKDTDLRNIGKDVRCLLSPESGKGASLPQYPKQWLCSAFPRVAFPVWLSFSLCLLGAVFSPAD